MDPKPNLELSISTKNGEKATKLKNTTKKSTSRNKVPEHKKKPSNTGRRQTLQNVANEPEVDSFKTDSDTDESEEYDEAPVKLQASKSTSVTIDKRRQSINSMLAANFKVERLQTRGSTKSEKEQQIKLHKITKTNMKYNQINFGNIDKFKSNIYK